MSPSFPAPPTLVDRLVLSPAGFWWRVLAWILDGVVLAVVDWVIGTATGLRNISTGIEPNQNGGVSDVSFVPASLAGGAPARLLPVQDDMLHFPVPHGQMHLHHGGLTLVSVLLAVGYFVLLESSRWQATIGKRICRLRVSDMHGRRIGIGRAFGRYLGKFLSALILGVGFLMAGWTLRKQGLHDLIARTLVMRLRPADAVFTFQPPPN